MDRLAGLGFLAHHFNGNPGPKHDFYMFYRKKCHEATFEQVILSLEATFERRSGVRDLLPAPM